MVSATVEAVQAAVQQLLYSAAWVLSEYASVSNKPRRCQSQ